MKKLKYEILFIILFMSVGIAAVSTNAFINGSTPIASNPDDFNVYFSDVVGDAVVKSSNHLHIIAELQSINDESSVSFLVVNGSKNYDALIDISCEGSDEYIDVSYGLESYTIESGSVSDGDISISLRKSYSGDDSITREITCELVATPIERDSLGSNANYEPASPEYPVGTEITLGTEKFNVIEEGVDTVTMLAMYNIGADYKQSTTNNYVKLYNGKALPGIATNIDETFYSESALDLLNNYKDYLINLTGDDKIETGLMTFEQLKIAGCEVVEGESVAPCSSVNNFFVLSSQEWWISYITQDNRLFHVGFNTVSDATLDSSYGIRPMVTVSKETINKVFISFTINGSLYYAEEGMYWTDWVDSSFNTGGFTISQDDLNFRVLPFGSACFVNPNPTNDSLLEDGADYTLSCEGGRE